MSSTDMIRVERHGALATVTLDRPERNMFISFFNQLPDLHGQTGAEYAITLLAAIGTSR